MFISTMCIANMVLLGLHLFSWAFVGRKRYANDAKRLFGALGVEALLIVNSLLCGMIKDGVVSPKWEKLNLFLLLVALGTVVRLWQKR